MKTGTVLTGSLSVRREPGGPIIGYLHRDQRVRIIGAPRQHQRAWWQIETTNGSPALSGWVADGDGDDTWLRIEEAPPAPPKLSPVVAPARKPRPESAWVLPVILFPAALGALALFAGLIAILN
jgi:hypothetical protein